MLTEQTKGQIRALAEEVSAREGCYVYDLEFVGRGPHRILRVFIDGHGQNVSIEQCESVSRGLSLLLDVEDLVPGGSYDLEVSSPGLERPLKDKWHFERVVGKPIKVKTREFVEPVIENGEEGKKRAPAKSLQGTLTEVAGDQISLLAEGRQWKIPLSNILKANLVFEMNTPGKAKNKKR